MNGPGGMQRKQQMRSCREQSRESKLRRRNTENQMRREVVGLKIKATNSLTSIMPDTV